jgi:hypothetical protein
MSCLLGVWWNWLIAPSPNNRANEQVALLDALYLGRPARANDQRDDEGQCEHRRADRKRAEMRCASRVRVWPNRRVISRPVPWAGRDLVERHAPRARDGERDDLGDVLRSDRQVLDELLCGPLGLGVRDVVGQLGRDGAGIDDRHADVGL